MTYSPVPEVDPGDLWTASQHNQYIKDNFAASVPDVFTAKGDLFAGTGSDAGVVLPVGTNGQTLVADSGQTSGLKWGAPGFLDKRQGGSGTDWKTAGTTNYTPANSVFMQAGAITWTGSANNNGNIVVTLPTTYTYNPLGWANCLDSAIAANILTNCFITSTSSITIYWRDVTGTNRTSVALNWWTMGE